MDMKSMVARILAGRNLNISLKNQLKRRLHAITIASATCFLFGIILIFYVDNIAEERLHMVFSSPRHIMVAGGCLIVFEIFYKMDFSLPGFLICCTLLGLGIYEATSLDRGEKDNVNSTDITNRILRTKMKGLLFQHEVFETHRIVVLAMHIMREYWKQVL